MIILFSRIPLKPGKREEFIEMARPVIVASREEKGNISYNLCKIVDSDNDVLYVEEWESKDALVAHGKSKHYLDFAEARKPLLAGERETKIFEAQPTGR